MSENVYWMDDSILDPFQQKKRKRMDSVKEMLKKLEKVNSKEFIAKVSACNGIDRITVRKYLEELEDAGYIEIKNGTIIWKQSVKNQDKPL